MNYLQLDEIIKQKLHYRQNFDVIRREVGINNKFILYYLSSLSDDYSVEHLNKSLLSVDDYQNVTKLVYSTSIDETDSIDVMAEIVLAGQALLITCQDDCKAYYLDVRSYPTRGISEPETEQSIRGAKDGFNENFISTIGLIRRRIKSPNLRIDIHELGEVSRTYISLVYMENTVNQQALEELKKRIEKVKTKLMSLVMTDRALEELIFKQKWIIYPLVRYTERPDIASIQILKGKIAIVCDTSNSVIITPISIFDQLQHVEEFRHVPIIGIFMRLLRLFAIITSILLIPLWLVFLGNETLSAFFFATVDIPNYTIFIIQILIVEITLEILRIATVHTPSKLSSAMGLVAALILGQIATEIGLFIPEILLYCALSAIGGFATPSYELSLANKLYKIFLIILTACFGLYGFIGGIILNIIYLSMIKVLGVSYLSPLIPFNFKKLKAYFSRKNSDIYR